MRYLLIILSLTSFIFSSSDDYMQNEFNQQFDLLIKYRNSFDKDTLDFDLDYAFNIFELYKNENPTDSEAYVALAEALISKYILEDSNRPHPILDSLNSEKSQLQYQLMQLEQEIYDKVINENNSEVIEYWLSVYQIESEEINAEIKPLSQKISLSKKILLI